MRARTKSEFKKELRAQARQKVRREHSVKGQKSHRDAVETGRRRLLRVSCEAGDPKALKVRNELAYLLNNYAPCFDTRIEQLIDDWRRSGDPSYDPAIRLQWRRARQDHMSDSELI